MNLIVLLSIIVGTSLLMLNTTNASSEPRRDILEKALSGIEKIKTNITDSIDNFHFYDYDGHPYDIHDGGYGMYDGIGNKVYHTDEGDTDVLYDFNLAYGSYVYGVRSTHPLFGVAWIRNVDSEKHIYRYQIEGQPGLGKSRKIQTSERELTLNASRLQYKTFQVFSEGLPSICEVYFVLENDRWGSVAADNFTVMTFSKTAEYLQNAVYLTGRPKNLLLNYMLLSNSNGLVIPEEEIENILKISANAVLEIDNNLRNFTEVVLQAIEAELPNMRDSISDWYNYTYTMQEIATGGENMYGRRGNQIHFSDDAHFPTKLYYDRWYNEETYQVTSRATHPFYSLMWITNPNRETHSYSWEVTGFAGQNRLGLILKYDGVLEDKNTTIHYKVFTLSNIREHPSVCEVYFVVDSKTWDTNSSFSFEEFFGNDTENLSNKVTITGTPQNILSGYLLLSKKNASRVRDVEIRRALSVIMEEINSIEEVSDNHLQRIRDSIERVSNEISSSVENWHQYVYDEQFYNIAYEQREMYNPWGNKMIIAEDLDHATYKRTSYDLYYKYPTAAIRCLKDYPFTALMLVENDRFDAFSLNIHSHVETPGSEKYAEYEGSLTVLGTEVRYFAFQIYNREQASVCEVFFTLSNPTNWSSVLVDFYVGSHFERSKIRDNYIYLLGYTKRVFLGYILLSVYPGTELIPETKIRSSLTLVAQEVTKSLPKIEDIMYCKEEVLSYPYETDLLVTFPESPRNSIAFTIEKCQEDTSGQSYGSRKCSMEGVWEEPIWITSCEEDNQETVAVTTIPSIQTTSGQSSLFHSTNLDLLSFIIGTIVSSFFFTNFH